MFLGYEVGRVAKALVAALPAVLLFLVFTTLAMVLLPGIPPKLWYLHLWFCRGRPLHRREVEGNDLVWSSEED